MYEIPVTIISVEEVALQPKESAVSAQIALAVRVTEVQQYLERLLQAGTILALAGAPL